MPPLRGVVRHLVIINVLVFFAVYYVFSHMSVDNPISAWLRSTPVMLALNYPASALFRPYQFITHMFMHGSFQHLFFNMFSLWMFGSALEMTMGPKRFLKYYFICGFGAVLLHLLVWYLEVSALPPLEYQQYLQNPGRVLGASGAVFGLLAGYAYYYPNNTIMLLIPPIPLKAKYFVLIIGIIELFLGLTINTGVAHFAHLGGALIGLLVLKSRFLH